MKRILFFLSLTVIYFNTSLNAQNYFSENTTWVYNKPTFNANISSYTTLVSKGDSIFNGDTLTYLEGVVNCAIGENSLIKQIDKKIYRLNTCDSSYSLLYNFGAEIGDTLFIPSDICEYNDTIQLYIDTIFMTNINGVEKKTFGTTVLTSGITSFYGPIIEGIGNLESFYPMLEVCDPNGSNLRCFTDSDLGEYNLNGGDCYFNNIGLSEVYDNEFQLYPNPNNGNFSIHFNTFQPKISIRIVNTLGQFIFEKTYNETKEIQMNSNYPKGIYFLHILNNEKEKKTIKFRVE